MAAALGDRGERYMGLSSVCDRVGGGDYGERMAQLIARQQDRLGMLRGLVNRAYRGQPDEALRTHMQQQMARHQLTATQFCDAALRQAQEEFSQRTDAILALGAAPLTLAAARDRGWVE